MGTVELSQHSESKEKFQFMKSSLSIQERVSCAAQGSPEANLQLTFRLQIIIPKIKHCKTTWLGWKPVGTVSVLSSPLSKTKPQTGVWDSKKGCWKVDSHQENDASPCQIYDMNETNGWRKMKMVGVWSLADRAKPVPTIMNGETAAELMKKKVLFFFPFIHFPRIINQGQTFWCG